MPTRSSLLLVTVLASSTLAGCEHWAWGSGDPQTVTHAVAPFDAIDNRSPLRIEVRDTDDVARTRTASVTCDDNLVDLIDVEVVHGTLRVDTPDHVELRPEVSCVVEVESAGLERVSIEGPGRVVGSGAFERLTRLEIEGPGRIDLDGLATSTLGVAIEGPGRVDLAGTCDMLEVVLDGPARLAARALEAHVVVLDADGPAHAEISADDRVDIAVDGPGHVVVHGDPRGRAVDIDGPGDVDFR